MEGPEKLPRVLPGLDRVVGADEFTEDYIKLDVAEAHMRQTIKVFEREKTIGEEELILDILERMPDFIKEYGAKQSKLILNNHVHILDESKQNIDEVRQLLEKGTRATISSLNGRIEILPVAGEYFETAHAIVHELIHANSFQSDTLTKGVEEERETISTKLRRRGLGIYERKGKISFKFLNEAVTEELARRFCERYFADMEHVRDEFEKFQSGNQEVPGSNRILAGLKDTPESLSPYSYKEDRLILGMLVQELYDDNKDTFKNPEEVFHLFTKAMFTGRLLEVARLIKKTKGKKFFRALGGI